MPTLSNKKVAQATSLLQKLVRKVDNGDEILTAYELHRTNKTKHIRGSYVYVPQGTTHQLDTETETALLAAINRAKSKSQRGVDEIAKGIGEAGKEAKAADRDGDGKLSDAEAKKVRSPLGKSLVAFARVHGGDSISDFKIDVAPVKVYVPKRPFVAPKNKTAPELVEALLRHFNDWGNDNHVGIGSRESTRHVLATAEAEGITRAIAKLPETTAKAVLREFSKRIKQPDYRGNGFEPKRVYVMPKAVGLFDKLAKKLGVTASFVGNPVAPKFDFY